MILKRAIFVKHSAIVAVYLALHSLLQDCKYTSRQQRWHTSNPIKHANLNMLLTLLIHSVCTGQTVSQMLAVRLLTFIYQVRKKISLALVVLDNSELMKLRHRFDTFLAPFTNYEESHISMLCRIVGSPTWMTTAFICRQGRAPVLVKRRDRDLCTEWRESENTDAF